MRNINRGKIINEYYVKYVDWNKAVLWMTKEISLPIEEMKKIYDNNVKYILFIDEGKNEQYLFDIGVVDAYKKFKKVGQEPQFYWGIGRGQNFPYDERYPMQGA